MLLKMIDKVLPRAPVERMGVFYRWDCSDHKGLYCRIVSQGCNRATDRYNLMHVSSIKMNNIRDYIKHGQIHCTFMLIIGQKYSYEVSVEPDPGRMCDTLV